MTLLFLPGGGGGHFHMLGVRGCAARQGVFLIEGMCSLRVYVFANFSCLCSLRYAFQHSKLCVLSGYIISRFLIVFYVLSGPGSGSPGGTTPSILVSIPPPPPTTTTWLNGLLFEHSKRSDKTRIFLWKLSGL